MTRRAQLALGCAAAIAWPAVAHAGPVAEPTDGPASGRVAPKEAPRRFYLRLGGALVQPFTQSRELQLADVDGPASLAVQNGPIAGSGATFESATVPAFIVGYVLPTARRRWSIEAVLGVPFRVKFQATGTLADASIAPTALGLPTGIAALGPELGEAKVAPPIVTAVYQLTDGGAVRPFVGAGVSVLFAFDARVTNPMLTAVGKPEMSIAPAPGVVAQAGVDLRLWSRVFARIDAKFVGLMLARAEVRHVEIETPALPLFQSVEVGTAKLDVWVNPLVVQAAVGVDF